VRFVESNGERNRVFFILKSRGMEHSNQVRELKLTKQGVELVDVYLGEGMVLTGTARRIQEEKEKAVNLTRKQEFERKRRDFARQKAIVQSQITALQAQLEREEENIEQMMQEEQSHQDSLQQNRVAIAQLRQADFIQGNE
jgi:circadian clock protein KaiC